MRIEASMRLLGYHSSQLGTQGFAGDLHEPHARVKGEVPGHSPERRQGQHDVPGDGRPVAHRSDERRAQTSAPVRRVDVNFFEVGQVVGEHCKDNDIVVNAAKLANMKEMAAAKDRGIAAVYDGAAGKLAGLRSTPGYAQLFKALAEESLAGVASNDVVVKVDPADKALAESTLKELGITGTVDASLSTVGGLVVLTSGGRIRRRNTLEDRLDKVRSTRQAEVAEILFG